MLVFQPELCQRPALFLFCQLYANQNSQIPQHNCRTNVLYLGWMWGQPLSHISQSIAQTMIKITGATRQTFSFPADVPTASAFYSDFGLILNYLPHIQLVKAYTANQFRVMYHTVELNVYRVRIICDLQVNYDQATQTLHVTPLLGKPPVKGEATVQSLTAQGYFTSQSIFRASGDHCVVDYRLSLESRLPKPFGLMLMPDRVTQQIAQNITEWRTQEIANGFIKRSIKEFREQAALSVGDAGLRGPAARPEWRPVVAGPHPRLSQ